MDPDGDDVLDYIFFKGEFLNPIGIKIAGDKCLESDKTIYASDHYALVADFNLS